MNDFNAPVQNSSILLSLIELEGYVTGYEFLIITRK